MDSKAAATAVSPATSGGEIWLFLLPLLHNSTILPWLVAAILVAAMVAAIGRWMSPGGAAWGSLAIPSTIPGPSGLPFIGSLLDLGGGLAHRRLAAMASRGSRRFLMALSLGSNRLVIASEPSVARELLNSAAFADRPLKQSAQQLLFGRAIGFAPYGDYWRSLRRLAANHLFSPRRIAAHERFRQAEASTMLDCIAAASSSSVELRRFLQQASTNNIFRAVFGRRYDFESREGVEIKDMIREGFELLGAFNWADHIPALRPIDPQAIHERCAALVPKVRALVQAIIDEHRSRGASASSDASSTSSDDDDFVDVLLALKGDQALSDDDAIAVLWEMIFRGTDTTAILTEWILAELVLHPQIQDSLAAELRAAGELNDASIARLPLLNAVVKETLRLHPPGPLLSWARLAIHDTTVAGHSVPVGTTAMVNMWAITHDESIWTRPNEFLPQRFMAGGEAGPDFDVKGTDLRLAPFGAGRRVCPGRALGLATVNLWVARIVGRFKLLPDPSCPVDLSEVLKLSCEMIKPLRVVAVERDE